MGLHLVAIYQARKWPPFSGTTKYIVTRCSWYEASDNYLCSVARTKNVLWEDNADDGVGRAECGIRM